ncbi:3-oxoacyl-[acyl-carrier-protein] reductase 1 [Nocardia cerradoensis]|uniref:3-oxoacyl-[acyl-carrier-protein] reductase 1 n=1 Tax=Nocardia cerradoensis TaxID=85688 RepID=A0A231GXB7_9NOCA|nr:SDR family oxidoreductase [Nocardia cerradoensis]OXR41257.1 3-oxoacyl-[acyl-carrier-protein] reductase 1 [Nocardia cerradoensis]
MNRLQGKVAIVTGTSPNIGGTLARGLAAQGARVLCTDLTAEVAEGCAAEIVAAGGDAAAIAGDVTDPDHADAAVAAAVERWGKVDILVGNAVFFHQQGLLTMGYADFRRQLDVILGGSFLFTRAVAKSMIETKTAGSIILVLSTAAWQGQPGNIGYSTGKSGLINFTRSAAMELAPHGIRVNGFTPTATAPNHPAARAQLDELLGAPGEYRMDFTGQLPLSRLPTPDDYVGAVVYLASDESSMVTGTNITVDGGATAKYWPWTPHPI